MKLNQAGAKHAASLVRSGKIKDSASWKVPTTDEENAYIDKHSMAEFGKWCLGTDPDQDPGNKGRYHFIFTSDFEEADLSGLKACITRAAQAGYTAIEKKAQTLLDKAKKKLGKGEDENEKKDMFTKVTNAVFSALGMKQPVLMTYRREDGSPWLTVRNQADGPAEIVIDGPIGKSFYDDSGTTSKQFRDALNNIPKNKEVRVHINSDGGSVGDALTIHNLLQERGNVTCKIDGYALSSASIVALGGVRTHAPASSIMMIHEPWTVTQGDKDEHDKASEMLETHGDTIAQIYAAKTGMTVDECRKLMQDETWLTGNEAVEMGLADPQGDCPGCGHEFCSECERGDENTTCSECGEEHSNTEWFMEEDDDDQDDAKARAQARFAALNLTAYKNIPAHVLNRLRPESISSATAGAGGRQPAADNTERESMSEKQIGAASATTANTVTMEQLAEVRAALQREKEARIVGTLDRYITECRLCNDERPDALKRAMADESYLEVIAKRPPVTGRKPVGPSFEGVEIMDDVFHEIKKERNPRARNEMRSRDWAPLMLHAKSMDARGIGIGGGVDKLINLPVNANSVASALVVDTLADATITALVAVLPSLKSFTRDFAANPVGPLSTVQVRLVTKGGALQKAQKANVSNTGAITNYESGDHTISNVQVVMSEYSQAFDISSQELMSFMRIETLANHSLLTLGSNLVSDTLDVIATNTYTAGSSNGTIQAHYGTFSWNVSGGADMSTLRAQLGKSIEKYAILTPEYFSKLITIPIASTFQKDLGMSSATSFENVFGWNQISETTAWPTGMGSAATAGQVAGFGLNPQAIAVAARLPMLPPEGIPGNTLVSTTVLVPGLELSVALFQWFNLSTRTLWHSFGVVFGAAAGDLTALCTLQTLGV